MMSAVAIESATSKTSTKIGNGKPRCKLPRLEVNGSEVAKFFKPQKRITCSAEKDWVEIRESTAYITKEAKAKYRDIECSFTEIIRRNDLTTTTGLTTTTHTEYSLDSTDFVTVVCKSETGKSWQTVLSGIRHDEDVVDRAGWDQTPTDGFRMNVLMFGFDSLSRNSFIRKLPKSYDYVTKHLNAIVLEGYNIVGDGTPQAIIPILTGKTELELPDARRRMGEKATYVNVYPFVWNNFKNNGYVTAFMEDTPKFGTFTYRLKGFQDPPTDHYMRPFYLASEGLGTKDYCIGSLPKHKIMMDYATNVFRVYRDKPKFVFGFHGELSHDDYNLIQGADDDLLEWVQLLKNEGHLNNTLLILMSDHGHRFAAIRNTQQGKLEERLPWFSFILPPSFEKSFPKAAANLRKNAQRLTTPFDIYSTLLDVIHFQGAGRGDLSERSISLFKEIPEDRTCADAFIEPHWCACLDWERLNEWDPVVQRAATALVQYINKYNAEYTQRCEVLSLGGILWSARLVPNESVRKFQKNADVDGFIPNMDGSLDITMPSYQIKIITKPGSAIFEASLVHYVDVDKFSIRIEDISRINKYGSQADCIIDELDNLRKFCYCKKG